MDGWTDGWMDGWMDGWTGWTGWTEAMMAWIDGWMDGWMAGRMDEWMDGWLVGLLAGCAFAACACARANRARARHQECLGEGWPQNAGDARDAGDARSTEKAPAMLAMQPGCCIFAMFWAFRQLGLTLRSGCLGGLAV